MWVYMSSTFAGNLHQTVHALNEDAINPKGSIWGKWEAIAFEFNGGGYTTVVFKQWKDR